MGHGDGGDETAAAEISPLTLAWLRILPAAVVLLLAARLLQRPWQVDRRDWPWLLLFALVDGALFHGFWPRGSSAPALVWVRC